MDFPVAAAGRGESEQAAGTLGRQQGEGVWDRDGWSRQGADVMDAAAEGTHHLLI